MIASPHLSRILGQVPYKIDRRSFAVHRTRNTSTRRFFTKLSVVAGNRKDLPETIHLYVSGVALGAERDQLATHGVSPLPGQFKIGARAADIIGKAGQQHLGRRPIFL